MQKHEGKNRTLAGRNRIIYYVVCTLNFALHVFAFQEAFCVLSKVVYVIV